MPDFGRVKYRRNGDVVVTGQPPVTVGHWEKNARGSWDVICTLPGQEKECVNALPRSLADKYVLNWHRSHQTSSSKFA
ncbi:hypothetical protein KUV57_13560 [Epibacterium sp. DP7N7-1]|nr:hypothetical protein [Epibacterium sp. DP7N7-1]